ncbi:hypothetical protein BJY01DRAFT_235477 [Aspergillus pseudoustus]|uniref:NAD(P)-binding protein n=1 Tax=Aspergillus pseudoustus TaxID=1810923 RepID=A0ABR4JVV4_9EURO
MTIAGTKLDGVALVFGSGRGIGQQAAFLLAEAGARAIVFADLNEETARASAQASKRYATNTEYTATHFAIDNGTHLPVAEMSIPNFDSVMATNTRGMLLCCHARKRPPCAHNHANPSRRATGRLDNVNVASANFFAGLPGKGAYTISKHGCMGVTKMPGLDHSAEGVRCNALCLVWVRKPLLDEELRKNPEVQGMIKAMVPIGRAAECEEVGDTIVYLLSPSASYINGTSLVADRALTTTIRLH